MTAACHSYVLYSFIPTLTVMIDDEGSGSLQ